MLILKEVLITLTRMAHKSGPKLVSHCPPSIWRLSQSVYNRTLSARVQHILCHDLFEYLVMLGSTE